MRYGKWLSVTTAKLGGGLVVVSTPVAATVEADAGAAVVGHDHALVVFGGYPHIVVVAVGGVVGFERGTAVGTFVVADIGDIDDVLVLGVGIDAGVVPSALAQARESLTSRQLSPPSSER